MRIRRNALALLSGAAITIGIAFAPTDAKAFSGYCGQTANAPMNWDVAEDSVTFYYIMDLYPAARPHCNVPTVTSGHQDAVCRSWNTLAQYTVGTGGRQLSTGQRVTIQAYAPGNFVPPAFQMQNFSSFECLYVGVGNVPAPTPPLTFTPQSGGRYGSHSGIVGTGTNLYGPIPGPNGTRGQFGAGDSTSPRSLD